MDQNKVHYGSHSDSIEERKSALFDLKLLFDNLPDKIQAENDLHHLLVSFDDEGIHSDVIYAYSHNFSLMPDKKLAQNDLHYLIDSNNNKLLEKIIDCFRLNFSLMPDKELAWTDLVKMTKNESRDVRRSAIESIGEILPHVENIEEKWDYLYQLMLNESSDIKNISLLALRKLKPNFEVISKVPNIWVNLWYNLHKFIDDNDPNLRFSATELIGLLFRYLPNKGDAWKDLIKLSSDVWVPIKQLAPRALGWSFQYVPKDAKPRAWYELCQLSCSSDPKNRWGATIALGDAYQWSPDRFQTFEKIHNRTYDVYGEVRRAAVIAIHSVFPYLINKKQALDDLGRLLNDDDMNVREWTRDALKEISQKDRVQYLSEIDIILSDILKSRYQKERKVGQSEVNSKTLKLLKNTILALSENSSEIKWMDIGCGNGRCLEVLDALKEFPGYDERLKKVHYLGIDLSDDHIESTMKTAEKYSISKKFIKMNAIDLKYDSEFDIISAILVLHEIDPIQLPCVLRNIINAIKEDGVILVSDFNEPYEQEENIVIWNIRDLMHMLDGLGGIIISQELIATEKNPNEFSFYRCCVRKSYIKGEIFEKFLQKYDQFLDSKIDNIICQYHEIGSQLRERVHGIISRPNINAKNITEDEIKKIEVDLDDDDVQMFRKRRSLLEQILFLKEKINQIEYNINPMKIQNQFETMLKLGLITESEYLSVEKILSRLSHTEIK